MSRRLTQLIALWFVVQIVVPFTAPLQVLDLHDWLGANTRRSNRTAPESSTTPTIKESSAAGALAPLVAWPASNVSFIGTADTTEHAGLASVHRTPRASSIQRSVLRL